MNQRGIIALLSLLEDLIELNPDDEHMSIWKAKRAELQRKLPTHISRQFYDLRRGEKVLDSQLDIPTQKDTKWHM